MATVLGGRWAQAPRLSSLARIAMILDQQPCPTSGAIHNVQSVHNHLDDGHGGKGCNRSMTVGKSTGGVAR
jgi:hypothetical protein